VKAWQANAKFYAGAGVPVVERFQSLRVELLLLGPGLPSLSQSDKDLIPAEVSGTTIFQNAGGYLHRAPDDQSNCDHLGMVMKGASTIRDGRCDFYEPFGRSNTWWIVEAETDLPQDAADYYVVVWPRLSQTGKVNIAVGTWVENFFTPYPQPTPTCTIDLSDFHEKQTSNSACLPAVMCPSTENIGCLDTNPGTGSTDVLSKNCMDESTRALYHGQMVCGGNSCPNAARLWDEVNMRMHSGMAIKYTGDVERDFVYGMIPHHNGALEMCNVLINNLTCVTWSATDELDGLVHLCRHIQLEQDLEVKGMQDWLSVKSYPAMSMCDSHDSHGDSHGSHGDSHGSHGDSHGSHGDSHGEMSMGCGNMNGAGAQALVKANQQMHDAMAVQLICKHPIDFVRMMLPHHAGAVAMVDALRNSVPASQLDPYLDELATNITRKQYAEMAWMRRWMEERNYDIEGNDLRCKSCEEASRDAAIGTALQCEDLISTTTFCHGFTGTEINDQFCTCEALLTTYPCDSLQYIDGTGQLNVTGECLRSCGKCPVRPNLFPDCSSQNNTQQPVSSSIRALGIGLIVTFSALL